MKKQKRETIITNALKTCHFLDEKTKMNVTQFLINQSPQQIIRDLKLFSLSDKLKYEALINHFIQHRVLSLKYIWKCEKCKKHHISNALTSEEVKRLKSGIEKIIILTEQEKLLEGVKFRKTDLKEIIQKRENIEIHIDELLKFECFECLLDPYELITKETNIENFDFDFEEVLVLEV